jgi:hypothetical protein
VEIDLCAADTKGNVQLVVRRGLCVVAYGCARRLGANVLQLVQPWSIFLINRHQLPYPGLEDHDIQILEEEEDK